MIDWFTTYNSSYLKTCVCSVLISECSQYVHRMWRRLFGLDKTNEKHDDLNIFEMHNLRIMIGKNIIVFFTKKNKNKNNIHRFVDFHLNRKTAVIVWFSFISVSKVELIVIWTCYWRGASVWECAYEYDCVNRTDTEVIKTPLNYYW